MEKLVQLLTNFLLVVSIYAYQNAETQGAKNVEKKSPNEFKKYSMITCGKYETFFQSTFHSCMFFY